MRNKDISLLIWVFFIVLIIIIPLFLDKVILNLNIIADMTVSQNIAFWGNYASAILRSIMSLVGVMLTIRYYINKDKQRSYKKEFKEEKLIIYYFRFLESINELKETIIKEDDEVILRRVWNKCYKIYKLKVIIGKELIGFDSFANCIEEYIRLFNDNSKDKEKERCVYEIDRFYNYVKAELLK